MTWRWWWVMACCACGPAPRVGVPLGPGAARAQFEQRYHGTESTAVDVTFPADADGAPLPGPFPAVVFIQGGLVAPQRYGWLAEALAARGVVVAVPAHPLQLALLDSDVGEAARALLVAPPPSLLSGLVDPGRIAVAGHSLGGVVAAKLALRGGFAALVFEASLPDAPDVEPLSHLRVPSLSLAGANDCNAKRADVTAGAQALAHPTALVVLDGVTHYQFTNDDGEDRSRGCASGVPLDTAHDRIVSTVSAFLDAALGPSPSVGEAQLRAVPGAEVTVR